MAALNYQNWHLNHHLTINLIYSLLQAIVKESTL